MKNDDDSDGGVPTALPAGCVWYDVLRRFGVDEKFKLYGEHAVHSHVASERADLFHTPDKTGTEVEVLNLLQAFVMCFKPNLVLETGTYRGLGTLALASGLAANGFGTVISIEANKDFARGANRLISEAGFKEYVEIVEAASLDYIAGLTSETVFDVVFFDTHVKYRIREFLGLYEKGCLGDIAMFHDTSRLRDESAWPDRLVPDYVRSLDRIANEYCMGHIEMPFSRGLRIMQLKKVK